MTVPVRLLQEDIYPDNSNFTMPEPFKNETS